MSLETEGLTSEVCQRGRMLASEGRTRPLSLLALLDKKTLKDIANQNTRSSRNVWSSVMEGLVPESLGWGSNTDDLMLAMIHAHLRVIQDSLPGAHKSRPNPPVASPSARLTHS